MTTTLKPGDVAPDFTLTNDKGEDVTLSDLKGQRVIVYFYPAAMTPGCTTEACDFSSAKSSLDSGEYVVLGISPDKPEKLAKFREKEDLTITLLSDVDRSVMTAYGAYGDKMMYGKKMQGIIRSTFVIGPDGRLAAIYPKVSVKGHAAAVMAAL